MALIFLLALSIIFQGTLGELVCENLPVDLCSFSISSSGNRCLLENYMTSDGSTRYQCKTSAIVVDKNSMMHFHEYIENDECISECGVDRKTIGISSDALLQPHFTAKLCSHACYHSCPNIVDLHFNLALAEGVHLQSFCEAIRKNPRRGMIEFKSSSDAEFFTLVDDPAQSPAPAPMEF